MRLEDAQREMRDVYLGGSVGTFVSAVVWAASAAVGTWGSRAGAMLALVGGGMLIFPATTLVLRLAGRRATASRENPLNALAMQVAFIVPLAIPLVLAAARARPEWFYAGFLVVVGAHYLPFVTLYGSRLFLVPAALMLAAGWTLPFIGRGAFEPGGWAGAAILAFSGALLTIAHPRRARASRASPGPGHSP